MKNGCKSESLPDISTLEVNADYLINELYQIKIILNEKVASFTIISLIITFLIE